MKGARRALLAGWLALTILGALNHTLIRDIVPRALVHVFPNLKYGYVMFNRNLTEVGILNYKAGSSYRHISEWMPTPAPGYKNARATISMMMLPDYLEYLCAQRTNREPTELRLQVFDVLASPEPVDVQFFYCRQGALHEQ